MFQSAYDVKVKFVARISETTAIRRPEEDGTPSAGRFAFLTFLIEAFIVDDEFSPKRELQEPKARAHNPSDGFIQ